MQLSVSTAMFCLTTLFTFCGVDSTPATTITSGECRSSRLGRWRRRCTRRQSAAVGWVRPQVASLLVLACWQAKFSTASLCAMFAQALYPQRRRTPGLMMTNCRVCWTMVVNTSTRCCLNPLLGVWKQTVYADNNPSHKFTMSSWSLP